MPVHPLHEYRFTVERDDADFILRLDGEPLGAYASQVLAEQAAQQAADEIRPGVKLEFRPSGDILEANLIVPEAE